MDFSFFLIIVFLSVCAIVYLIVPTIDRHLHSFMSKFSILQTVMHKYEYISGNLNLYSKMALPVYGTTILDHAFFGCYL